MKSKFSTSIRLPTELDDKIRHLADVEHRSLSEQIIYILEKYFEEKKSNN